MKKTLSDIVLKILVSIVAVIAIWGIINYIKNINQNAFAVCELVVCAYCALSIVFKYEIYNNTKQTALKLKQKDNGNGKRENNKAGKNKDYKKTKDNNRNASADDE